MIQKNEHNLAVALAVFAFAVIFSSMFVAASTGVSPLTAIAQSVTQSL